MTNVLLYQSPLIFILDFDSGYQETDYIQEIDKTVTRGIFYGDPNRILINIPPQHGKSTYISKYLPAWYLSVFPNKRVILASYESSYAMSWGREVRNIIDQYGQSLENPIKLSQDTQAKNNWLIDGYNGGMIATGVGGPITGKSGDLIIIDDPVKNYAQAISPTYRQSTIDWYKSVVYTRQQPGTVIILIMTRWHEGDLGGYLINEDSDDWHQIIFPAIAEENDMLGRAEGEALWPERYSVDTLNQIKATLGTKMFSSLYQQSPKDTEGGFFHEVWLKFSEVTPTYATKHSIRAWDLAATTTIEADDPDWCVGLLLQTGDYERYYISDIVRFRGTPETVENMIQQTAIKDGKSTRIVIEQEGGGSGKGWPDSIARTRLPGYTVIRDMPKAGKTARALQVAAAAERGDLYITVGSWNAEFIKEVTSFPDCNHDDQVDALSMAYNYMSSMVSGKSRGVIMGKNQSGIMMNNRTIKQSSRVIMGRTGA